MAALDNATARRLARSILEARREGRTLRPLTNTHLLTHAEALRIQDALLDLRIGQGEQLIGWYFEQSGEVAPLTDRMIFQTQPIGLVDAKRIHAVAIGGESATAVEVIIDRVIKGGLAQDFLAHGCGLVGIIMGDPVEYKIEGTREEVTKALELRKRKLLATDLVIRSVR